ncbi:COR domain-containing protein [Larkinella sp. C7]|uniref:COR domain-containing protein n=1 Tax=Larkinella sp. C7 TaxID=2576607 RepID=UPI001487250E|nr:COR domain-containing protein [Larkinella sp. C7]
MKNNKDIVRHKIQLAKENKSYSLDLSGLGLREVPEEVFGMIYINDLNLSFNNLTILPDSINLLYNLKYLDVSYNSLNHINGIGFSSPCNLQLIYLDLSYNNFSEIPKDIYNIEFIEDVVLTGNSILEGIPSYVIENGYIYIDHYYREILLSKYTDSLFEAKMIFVGQGDVGKTSLMKKNINDNFAVIEGKESTTHGINIKNWNVDIPFYSYEIEKNKFDFGDLYDEGYFEELEGYYEVKDEENNESNLPYDDNASYYKKARINMWDFGGQEIYYSTHQFFLTKRSIYVFVWDARKEEEYRGFEYWFNTINILSENSSIIIVMNKSDVRTKHIDQETLKRKFPNIAGFYQVSCVMNSGIDDLRIAIINVFKKLPHLGDKLPKVWIDIRNRLNNIGVNYITYEKYLEICSLYKIPGSRAVFLSDYFHDLGDILHYSKDEALKNIVILNPDWATNAFYKLIDNRDIQKNNGKFSLKQLEGIWDQNVYPRDKHFELIKLMERFEICFNLIGTYEYIIPELLQSEISASFDDLIKFSRLKFEYDFSFMPAGLMPRFICRNFLSIERGYFWKNGIVIRFEDSLALIVSQQIDRKIKVYISGEESESLLAIIRREYATIFDSIKLKKDEDYFEKIPCNCRICGNSLDPFFYKYGLLKKFQNRGKTNTVCEKSVDDVSISSLLKGYEKPRPGERILEHLIIACSQLQGNHKIVNSKEDSRNSYISTMLSNRGLITKDQSRWGSSPSSKSQGEIDIKIDSPSGLTLGIFEGLNLGYLDSNKIHSHLEKIFDYDPNGLESNFIVVYSEASDFLELWNKYKFVALNAKTKYPRIGDFSDISDNFNIGSQLKIGRTFYMINEDKVSIYHIFINMNC